MCPRDTVTLYSMHGLTPPPLPHRRKTGHKRALAFWGFPHLRRGGASSRGQGKQWRHSTVCMVYPPLYRRKNGCMQTLAVWGYSHLVGGGVRHRGCILGALYSMHDLPPPLSKEDWTQAVACTLGLVPSGWRRG